MARLRSRRKETAVGLVVSPARVLAERFSFAFLVVLSLILIVLSQARPWVFGHPRVPRRDRHQGPVLGPTGALGLGTPLSRKPCHRRVLCVRGHRLGLCPVVFCLGGVGASAGPRVFVRDGEDSSARVRPPGFGVDAARVAVAFESCPACRGWGDPRETRPVHPR